MMNKEARFYIEENGKIRCSLCPHNCLISEGNRGICNVREAIRENGKLKLFSINYGEITSIAMDPIEKKPLYHFYPGTQILSIGSFGCNFKCSFCQNYSISQYRAESRFISPEDMANTSIEIEGNMGLAFTYNEPTIWYEYVYEVSKEIKKRNPNHKTVLVTNGYINEEPLRELLPFIDGLNIDLKGNGEYYKRLCFGSLEEVERTIRICKEMGKHVEVTTLLVPGDNTDDETIERIGAFLSSVDRSIPLHISRYFPRYKMDKEQTPIEEIKRAYWRLKEVLEYVYLGNLSEVEKKYCEEKL
ncbi:MAG: AmmeMemoRadiSam system radical SAM enzyme [Clostridium sp.]